ncbi:hypothetical protein ACJIZ3_001718 [Penstemon smallii]|uniref:F-box protein n=1 Tax=Penstemon smallii TaxID=265156 RepID=A0ABD3U7A9_9LAMI
MDNRSKFCFYKRKTMADWSNLPLDLLMLIARRFNFLDDYVRFGVVCKSWRAVLFHKDSKNSPCSLLPLLMLTENESNDLRGFSSPFNKKVYQLYLPEVHGKRCWGSSHGWLITLDAKYQLRLLNPLSRVQILLPSLLKCLDLKNLVCRPEHFRDIYVHKVVLSSNPFLGNCVVLAIYSNNKMAFAKPGDESWTPLQCCPSYAVNDAICFGGKFYVTDSSEDVTIYDSNGNHLKTVALTSSLVVYEPDEVATYIAEVGGQIYVIVRIMYDLGDTSVLRTWNFKVYKLDKCNEKFEMVKTLGNWSIFIGNNHSFSIPSTEYPECTSNCIYFTDDYYNPRVRCSYDMGIYSLDNHGIKPFLQKDLSYLKYSVPVWIKPLLW